MLNCAQHNRPSESFKIKAPSGHCSAQNHPAAPSSLRVKASVLTMAPATFPPHSLCFRVTASLLFSSSTSELCAFAAPSAWNVLPCGSLFIFSFLLDLCSNVIFSMRPCPILSSLFTYLASPFFSKPHYYLLIFYLYSSWSSPSKV